MLQKDRSFSMRNSRTPSDARKLHASRAPSAAVRLSALRSLESLEQRICMSVSYPSPPASYVAAGLVDFVAAADLDGDGSQDLVVSSYDASALTVFINAGDGTFPTYLDIPLTAAPDYVTTGDLNNDGSVDLVTASYDGSVVSVLMGNGDGTFQTAINYAAGSGARAVTLGDFTGDGKLDIAVAKSFGTTLTILRNNGTGTFQAPLNTTLSFVPSDLTTGDFNLDGKLDLAASAFMTDKVAIMLGNANGTFATAVTYTTGAGPISIAAADVNADGRLDVLTANYFGNTVSVLLGNTNGTLQAATSLTVGSGPTFVAAADADSDGRIDILSVNSAADTFSVLCGTGAGAFAPAVAFSTGNSPRSLVVADFDGTGRPDVAVANQGISTVNVFLGGGTVTPAPVANLGGPYSVAEAGSVVLSGSSSTGTSLTYAWDLDNDSIYGETGASATRGTETGVSPTFSAAGLDGSSSFTIRLRVTDSAGVSNTATGTISISNVAPALTLSGGSTGTEGSTYTLSLAATDPGTDTISKWVINWGDGNTQTINSNPSTATHVFTDNSTYTVSATATDEDGTYAAGNTKAVTVSSVNPTLTLAGSSTGTEGSTYTLSLSATDPGADTISKWVINWGDGNTQTISSNPSTAAHVFADNGSYAISATATDEDGTYAAGNTKTVAVSNVNPVLTLAGSSTALEGASYTLSLSVSDPGSDTLNKWVINWGDGATQTISSNPSTAAHVFSDNSLYTISATATDEDGSYAAGNTKAVTIGNVSPALVLSGAATGTEGSTYTLSLSATDPGTDTINKWVINWGDGNTQTINSNPSTATHVFTDNSIYTVSATATDEDGTYAAATSKTVTVSNVSPTLTLSGGSTGTEGTSYTLSVAAADPGTDTISRWVINWGDGNTQTINSNPSTIAHVFADNGNYTISATATDEDGTYAAGNTKTVAVSNVAPALTLSGAGTGTEGSTYTLSLAASDAGTDTISKWTINWGDGNTQTINSNPSAAAHVFADNGSYVISATATDEDGTYAAGNTKPVAVSQVSPVLTLAGSSTALEGASYTLSLSVSDPGADTISSWVIDWGDGGPAQTINSNPSTVAHVFADNGTDIVTASATDEDGTYAASNSKTVAVSNVAPAIGISGATTAQVGTTYTLSLTATDPGADTISGWSIDWGDGVIDTIVGNASTATHAYTGQSFAATISASATDEDGTYSVSSKSVSVIGSAPVANAGGPYTVNEEGTLPLSATGSTGLGELSYEWDLDGDGIFAETGSAAGRGDEVGLTPTFSAVGLNGPASFQVALQVSNLDGQTSTTSATINILDVAPVLSLGGPSSVDPGVQYTLTLSAAYVASDPIQSWFIDWGDGTSQTVIGNPSAVAKVFATPGDRTINATATDHDGTYSAGSKRVTVIAPVSTDTIGNTMDTALNLGGLKAGSIKALDESVGPADRSDYYSFTLASTLNIDAKLSNLADNADLMIYNSAGTRIGYSKKTGTTSERIALKLTAGTYYVRVLSTGTLSTPYRLRLEATSVTKPPAESIVATSLGSIAPGAIKQLDEAVSVANPSDYYSFTLNNTQSIYIKLMYLTDNANLELLDANGNVLGASSRTGTVDEPLQMTLTKGTYYIRVIYAGTSGTANYRLRVASV